MSDYNRELHHDDHHETIERLQAHIAQLTTYDTLKDRIQELEAELDELREVNASLVDRHNRESHGTASHEAMAYDQLKAELAELREAYEAKCREFETAKEPVYSEGMREGCEELMLEAGRMQQELIEATDRETRLRAELARLHEALEDIASWTLPGIPDLETCRVIARNALRETT